ncbi:hypothetical protein COV21_04030 [Candidatus Woesearchaeota archaeon CG10_big_fil_rev_8_21_14_0_10_45_5]|nr:MAG: hypothetical protein COV21_04030 [Candidatus Woesearchaeota archaeon CG10_big_fil_rev_8_21_14_0_10_45_5]
MKKHKGDEAKMSENAIKENYKLYFKDETGQQYLLRRHKQGPGIDGLDTLVSVQEIKYGYIYNVGELLMIEKDGRRISRDETGPWHLLNMVNEGTRIYYCPKCEKKYLGQLAVPILVDKIIKSE